MITERSLVLITYSKIDVQISKSISAGISGGISDPSFGLGDGKINFYGPVDIHQKNSIDTSTGRIYGQSVYFIKI